MEHNLSIDFICSINRINCSVRTINKYRVSENPTLFLMLQHNFNSISELVGRKGTSKIFDSRSVKTSFTHYLIFVAKPKLYPPAHIFTLEKNISYLQVRFHFAEPNQSTTATYQLWNGTTIRHPTFFERLFWFFTLQVEKLSSRWTCNASRTRILFQQTYEQESMTESMLHMHTNYYKLNRRTMSTMTADK